MTIYSQKICGLGLGVGLVRVRVGVRVRVSEWVSELCESLCVRAS